MPRLLFMLALLGAVGAWAQTEPQMSTLPKPDAKQLVIFEPPVVPNVAAAKPETIILHFTVIPGMHVNSNVPKSNFLIPTVLRLSPPTDVGATVHYPPGQELAFEFDPNEKLSVYTGRFDLKTTLSASRTASPGKYNVHGVLEYQGCNDRQCLPPQKLPIVFAINVGKSRVPRERPRYHGNAQSPHIH